MAMPHPNLEGISAALRSFVKPVTRFSDAFDFLRAPPHTDDPGDTIHETRAAIEAMRHAAQRLNEAAESVIEDTPPPAPSMFDDIERATDEAAAFDD